MKHTLITTDMTRNSINTMLYGIGFTKSLGLKAKLLHFLNQLPKSLVGGYPDSPAIQRELLGRERLKRTKQRLARIARTVNSKFKRPIITNHKVIVEHAQPGIIKASEKEDPAVVVLGTVAKDDWVNKIVGTVPSAVAAKTDVPALIVPKNQTFTGINKVLLVVADKENNMETLEPVLQYLKHWKAATTVLNVTTNENQQSDKSITGNRRLDNMMRSKGNTFSVIKGKCAAESILNCADNIDADLIVLPYEETSFFEGLFKTDLSQQLILSSKTPLLVC